MQELVRQHPEHVRQRLEEVREAARRVAVLEALLQWLEVTAR